jgi:ribonuclease P protein component
MYTFRKEERLHSKKAIDRLFAEGVSFYLDPFQVVRTNEPFEAKSRVRVLISIPRKKIRKAVDRNLVKRRIREAYRLHKNPFSETLRQLNGYCTVALIYSAGKIAGYKEIEEKIILILERLQKEYEKADQ